MGHYSDDYEYDRKQERKRIAEESLRQYNLLSDVKFKLSLPEYYQNKIEDILNYLKVQELKNKEQ